MEPILVTGAAGGTQGSTGRQVVELLLDHGQAVRAFVRAEDARAEELRKAGAEVVIGDLREINDVMPAMRGVRRAFFTYPVTSGLLDATGAFAAAAVDEGLERVVEVSQLAAGHDAQTPRMRQHWIAEQVFDWSKIGAVHLRAAVFFENLDLLVRASGGRELALPLGSPDNLVPLVGASDVSEVAARLLLEQGETEPIVRLTGQVLTVREIVSAFGIEYRDVPPDEWHAQALAFYGDRHTIDHLSKLWEIFRTIPDHPLYQVTPSIQQITGHPPQTLRDFLR